MRGGHLSASGTIITPVTAFAAAFSSISLFDDSVAYTQAVNQRSNKDIHQSYKGN